ncbi:MAG TPA: hypothetical protein VFX39_06585, partial [Gemmatimonadaceae bacterium]|nr:hypothetical protein [Gemmatimonadaceae bacterium]
LSGSRAVELPTTAPERVTYVDVPPRTLPPPAEPLPTPHTAPAPGHAPGTIAPSTPNTTTPNVAAPTAPRTGQRVSPVPTLPLDSAARAAGAAGRLPPRAPAARLPDGLTFPPPARAGAPATACVGPCRGGTTGGVNTLPGPLTGAERDSVLRAIGQSVPALAGEMRRRGEGAPSAAPADPGAIQPLGGVSLPIGLPGGGPSKAQRERDRRVHAENTAALARIKAREDSIARADSLERVRRQQRPPGGR